MWTNAQKYTARQQALEAGRLHRAWVEANGGTISDEAALMAALQNDADLRRRYLEELAREARLAAVAEASVPTEKHSPGTALDTLAKAFQRQHPWLTYGEGMRLATAQRPALYAKHRQHPEAPQPPVEATAPVKKHSPAVLAFETLVEAIQSTHPHLTTQQAWSLAAKQDEAGYASVRKHWYRG